MNGSYKVYEGYIESIWHNAKSIKKQWTRFPKESVENADLYKPVLDKIMTTQE